MAQNPDNQPMKKLATILALLGLSVSFTFAAEKGEKKSPEETFKALDANADGKVSLEEYSAKAKDAEKAKVRFEKLDANKDGSLTLEEFSAGGGEGKGKGKGKGKKDEEAKKEGEAK